MREKSKGEVFFWRGKVAAPSTSIPPSLHTPLTKDDGLGAPVVGGRERAEAFLRRERDEQVERRCVEVKRKGALLSRCPPSSSSRRSFSCSSSHLPRRVPDRQLQALALELQELQPEVDA